MVKKDNEKKKTTKMGGKAEAPADLFSSFKSWLAETGKQLVVAIFLVFIFRSSVVEPYKIPSGSMIPTLFIGDHIFVNKFAYGWKIPFTEYMDEQVYLSAPEVPERGDVIVFRYPRDESINYIKRVIGLPGDVIAVRDKVLFINENPVEVEVKQDAELMAGIEPATDREHYTLYEASFDKIKHPILLNEYNVSGSDYLPTKIPEGYLFVMGDNRDNSSDSRYWGFVPLKNVKGKAMFVWLNIQLSFKDGFKFGFKPYRIATIIK